MEQYPNIKLMQGATSIVELDLADFDFQGGSVVFTMRRCGRGDQVVRTWKFEEAAVHRIVFEDEFTATLDIGKHNYEYDVMWHLDGERFAQCAPAFVEVSRTVGGWRDGEDRS